MDDSEPIQWRRDADTSWTVRILWSLGVGTFFAAILIVSFWRIFDLAGQTGGQSVLVATLAALVATTFAVAVSGSTEHWLERLASYLPVDAPSGTALSRATDAALGTIAMGGVIGSLMVAGRLVSQYELLPVGAGPFTLLAALTLPLAVIALLGASFLRSVGALDREERAVHLYEPEATVPLEYVEAVSFERFEDLLPIRVVVAPVRWFGSLAPVRLVVAAIGRLRRLLPVRFGTPANSLDDLALVRLEYGQPDGRYVPGPRRLVVPLAVAREIQSIADA